ncbi:asparaginase [Granulosicoccus sp. 3-233]|uniref:asparaginase n=1 Tax=Granulosicoccus sp. 3-233 TaxID=3417969 RepID=UPI003D357191
MTSRVLLLHSGGTIGMRPTADGYRPLEGFGAMLQQTLNNGSAKVPIFEVVELAELIDSSNLQPFHWTAIANELLARWDDFDGFVVLHGTDTMAYTASALSFMLRGTDKPVILTGSQIPLVEQRSDTIENLQAAMLLAANPAICEVCVCFGRRLLRGNRCSKLRTRSFDAFDSPNYPWLADIGIDITLHEERLLTSSASAFHVPQFDPQAVVVIQFYPGIQARMVEAMLASESVRGVVLRSYGVGNAPDADEQLMAVLASAVERGIVMVSTSQCITGGVTQGAYASGAMLNRIGVVPASDMTLEAAFTKLHVLLASGTDTDTLRQQFASPLSGECQ